MKKKLSFFIVLIVVIFCLCSCNEGEGSAKQSESIWINTAETSTTEDEKDCVLVTIFVDYKESTGLNFSDDVIVYCDGVALGRMRNGTEEHYEFMAWEGELEFYLQKDTILRKDKTNKIELEVTKEDRTFYIEAKENAVTGLKIKLLENKEE